MNRINSLFGDKQTAGCYLLISEQEYPISRVRGGLNRKAMLELRAMNDKT